MDNLLKQAAEVLANKTALKVKHQLGNAEADELLTLTCGKQKYKWAVEAKTRLTRPILTNTLLQLDNQNRSNTLLIAPYINENLAELCRQEQVNFIDLAGNMYINQPPLYIDIRGQKPAPEHQLQVTRQLIGKAFQPKGMKLVMLLLLNPDLIKRSMRAIAQEAEIALGTVKQVLDDLKQLAFVIDKGKQGKTLAENEQLLTRWLDAYPHNLAAKLDQSLYTTDDLTALKKANLAQYGALWGGEVAAAAYTHYLRPKTYLIYAPKEAQKNLLKTFRLRRLRADENAERAIRVVEPPVALEKIQGTQPAMIAPLLVYAELLNSNDPRNLDTAKRLYHDYFA